MHEGISANSTYVFVLSDVAVFDSAFFNPCVQFLFFFFLDIALHLFSSSPLYLIDLLHPLLDQPRFKSIHPVVAI